MTFGKSISMGLVATFLLNSSGQGNVDAARTPILRGICLMWQGIEDLVLAGFDADGLVTGSTKHMAKTSLSQPLSMPCIATRARLAGGRNAVGEAWKHPNLRVGV